MPYPIHELEQLRPVPYFAVNLEEPFDANLFDSNCMDLATSDPSNHSIYLKYIIASNTMYVFGSDKMGEEIIHKDFTEIIGVTGQIPDAGYLKLTTEGISSRFISGYSHSLKIGGVSNEFRNNYLKSLLSPWFEFREGLRKFE